MPLFTVGPCEMHDSTLRIGGRQTPYFRNEEFSSVMLDSAARFKDCVYAHPDDLFFPLTVSGTGAMEAVALNSLHSDDRVLVVKGGSFGARFAKICSVLGLDYEVVEVPFGVSLTEEMLEPYSDRGFTALLINMDETSTGQLYDMEMVSGFCRDRGIYLVVDAISAFASDHIDMQKWGIGSLIVSSQKGLALPPGMSFVVMSKRQFEERVLRYRPKSVYFDFTAYAVDFERGQTPFTPAVEICLQLNDMLRKIDNEGGIEALVNRTASIAADFRRRLVALPVSLPSHRLSNALTPIMFDNADARIINDRLKAEYDIVLNPCGGDMAARMSRVAHIGNHTIEDTAAVAHALADVLS